MKISVVIPVYNSQNIIAETVRRTVGYFSGKDWDYKIILVNDGSTDNSWSRIKRIAKSNRDVTSVNLSRNFGQHNALICGLSFVEGEYAVTFDDDLQNLPSEMDKLIKKAEEGYDAVFGVYKKKKHNIYRNLGSQVVKIIVRCTFPTYGGVQISNFRLLRKDLVDRIINYKTSEPYLPGLMLLLCNNPSNVYVKHMNRIEGKSNYNLPKIVKLVKSIVFNYSSFPLKLIGSLGFIISITGFFLGSYYILKNLLFGTDVSGFTTLATLTSFLGGFIILCLVIVGEYLIRLVNKLNYQSTYIIDEIV